MSSSNPQIWTNIWNREFSQDENRLDIEREQKTVRWKKIKELILKKFGSFAGLNVVEIGAGRGIYSLLMALEGANITLLDNNEMALMKSREFFNQWGRNFNSICADAFSPPANLSGQFDVVMSFGFAEHFEYPKRFEIFKAHLDLAKPGGLILVSVPNAAYLPYRIGKWMLEESNKWSFGLEKPFWKSELIKIAGQLKLNQAFVLGSGVIGDTLNFWLIQRLFHLPGFLMDKIRNKQSLPLSQRVRYCSFDPATGLDDYFGYALVLTGVK